jgi:hypothetical protein
MPEHPYAGRADRFDAVLEAAKARSDADEALTALLRDPVRNWYEKVWKIVALGEIQGPVGSAAIREEFAEALAKLATARLHQRSWLRDLAGAVVYALRERDGPAATDVYPRRPARRPRGRAGTGPPGSRARRFRTCHGSPTARGPLAARA